MDIEPPALSPRLAAVMIRMEQRIDWEKRRRRDEMRVDTSPARDLLDRAGSPDRELRLVHVAGTKGKGSTAIRIAQGLAAAGRRVGVYSSPHVQRVTERVRIGADEVGDEELAAGLELALDLQAEAEHAGSPGARASWFDLMTVAAVICLSRSEVEWGVLEVGLGGRLDSTNAMDAELAVVTSIDLEHTEILGSTRVAIATEKAGVLRPGRPVVCGVPPRSDLGPLEDAGSELRRIAQELGCPFTLVEPRENVADTNLALASAVLDILGGSGLRDSAQQPVGGQLLVGQAAWSLPGRMERFSWDGTPVVLDGAHVASSLERVLGELERTAGFQGRPAVVLALATDKPAESLLKTLAGRVDTVFCTSVGSHVHRSAEELAAQAGALGIRSVALADPQAAVAAARSRVQSGGWVLVTGSLYLVGAVRPALAAEADPT